MNAVKAAKPKVLDLKTVPGNSVRSDPGRHQALSKLQVNGITAEDVANLEKGGFPTVETVAFATKKQLTMLQGIDEEKAEKIILQANKLVPMGFTTATIVHQKRSNTVYISTGSKDLDNLLGGGIEVGSITEIAGEFNTGKSQLCYTLAVTCQLPYEKGGADGKCVFIDTKGTFRSERLVSVAARCGLDKHKVLNNVAVGRAYNSDHQTQLVELAAALMVESRYALLIIDCLMSLYRIEYTGVKELEARQKHLAKLLRKLKVMAEVFGIAVVLTNQVYSQLCYNEQTKSDLIPMGGNILAHSSTTRLIFRKGKAETRICKVSASPTLPESEATFIVTKDGIGDLIK